MRILHVVHTSLPYIAGYCIRSAEIFGCQRDQGLELQIITSAQHPNAEGMEEEIGGIPHFRTPAIRPGLPPGLREFALIRALEARVRGRIASWRPDVVHAHSPMLVGIPALRAARRAGLPLVYEVRDLWENASVDRGKFAYGSWQYRLAQRLESGVLRHSDAVVTICEALKQALLPRVGRPERLRVVPNGVDAGSFTPGLSGERVRECWRLVGKKIVGYIGTFQPYEGLELLIRAMPQVRKRVSDAHLLIVGAGGVEEVLRREAAGMEAFITFTGRVPHQDVQPLYAACDVLAYPRVATRTTELTTPLKPLEAMAMARPVVVSDLPAMRELVDEERTGVTFPASDAAALAETLVGLLRDPVRCRRLGGEARAWIEQRRQWPQLVARYGELYGEVRGRAGSTPPP
jgi:PEP-CTERM/exosortase A-associated glycosyltransferase